MNKTKLDKQLKKFEGYLRVDRGLDVVTVIGYCRGASIALRRMRKFVPQYPDIKNYIAWMYEKNYSYSHITNTMLAIEHYTAFKGNPIKLSRPKKPKRIIKDVLSEAEVARIIQGANDVRKKALVTTLAYSGLRNKELCNLKVSDVDVGKNQITVIDGKNRTDGICHIAPECTKVIVDYLREFPRGNAQYLFTTLKRGHRMDQADVRKHLKKVAKKAGLDRRVYPHQMRHTLATNLLLRGANPLLIKEQLRHRHIETTMHYIESNLIRNQTEYEFHKPAYL